MLKKPASPDAFDTLGDTSGYARPIDDFGTAAAHTDHIANLTKLRDMLIAKRRYLAQDAMTYPVVFIARSQDIAAIQPLIAALDAAIEHERCKK